jgi:cell division protein FtsZ
VIDDAMGDEVRVTVIAAGFERWDDQPGRDRSGTGIGLLETERELRAEEDLGLAGDEFDVPDFLK